MVSGNDPVESLLSSIQVVKDAFSPLELSIKKATKDFEFPWLSSKNGRNNGGLLGQVDSADKSGINGKNNKIHISALKKKTSPPPSSLNEERKKGSSIKTILGMFSPNCGNADHKVNVPKERERKKGRDCGKDDGSCLNCLQFAMTWSVLVNGFVQAFPSPFKSGKKRCSKVGNEEKVPSERTPKSGVSCEFKKMETKKGMFVLMLPTEGAKSNEEKHLSLELLIGLIFGQITENFQKFDQSVKEKGKKGCNSLSQSPPNPSRFDHWKAFSRILEGKKADMNVFLGNLNFARVGGAPSTLVGVTSPIKEDGDDGVTDTNSEESGRMSAQKLATGLLNIPLSNVERLKTTLSTVSIAELMELVPHLGRPTKDIPDKKKLFSVQDFFRYTEAEGRRFFEELDRDGDGQVNLEDLEIAMRKRKLPRRYAKEFLRRARSHLFAKSFGWKQFLGLMEQREDRKSVV